MSKKMSGPAIFMNSMIGLMIVISLLCFVMYYGGHTQSGIVLWVGITSFMILYHFWLRIIMGNVTKLFIKHVNYNQWWFKEKSFEKKLYQTLKVKKWKDKALTYVPENYDLKQNTLEQIAQNMVKAELDHWVNEIISISSISFTLIWGELWIFAITAFVAMLFDAQFILIQRFNRPRVINIINKRDKLEKV